MKKPVLHIYVEATVSVGADFRVPLCGTDFPLPGGQREAHKLAQVNCEDCREALTELFGVARSPNPLLEEFERLVEEVLIVL